MRQWNSLVFIVVVFLSALHLSCARQPQLSTVNLICNQRQQPLGIDSPTPLLGWQIVSSNRETTQSAYRVMVAESEQSLKAEKDLMWDSGIVNSGESVNIPYAGKSPEPGERYFWKVKIWDNHGHESDWSEPTWWQSGLFQEAAWQGARWISYELLDTSLRLVPGIHGAGNHLGDKALQRPVIPQFRKSFRIERKPERATLSISGLGHYVSSINGNRVGDSFLAPGWTDYDKTVFYNTYDVTSMLTAGENVIGAIAGNGFYHINRERYRKLVIAFGMPKVIARLHLLYPDGSEETIVTDESWKAAPSPITYTSIFGGEDYDANLEQKGWDKPGFNDPGWQQPLVSSGPLGKLVAEADYPLKEMESFEAERITKLQDGSYLFDFGQNASGIVEITLKGTKGQEVVLWPSELINPDSSNNQRASGSPYYFSYTAKGEGTETWKPVFTYYGFRYVQVTGGVPAGESNPAGLPEIEKMRFLHTRNSAPTNGSFSCSNDLLNRIHDLIDWAIRSNLQSVVTDCPHREKLGWLEQTHLMGQGIHFRYGNYHLYRKLVLDMMDAQTSDGLVPDIAPEYVEFLGGFRDSPEWGSAAVILPWLLYKWYGDVQTIEEAWPMMMRYVDYLRSKSNLHILDYGLGDWFDLGPKQPGVSQLTPVSLTATAFYFYDVNLLSKIAAILNKPEAGMLQDWAIEIRNAFNGQFFNPETIVYSTGSQTAMSIPYCMGIVEEGLREEVFSNLVDSIVANNKALTAGDVGFHYLVEALTTGGASQLIFEMINRDDVPGYGFQLKKGATALTESWAALENVSNNHLMLGHVMEWFYSGLGGIGQAANSVGYRELEITPEIVGDLTFVKTGFQSPYGLIRSEWERTDTEFHIEVEIPHNASATLFLPVSDLSSMTVNGNKPGEGLIFLTSGGKKTGLRLGSGIYRVSADLVDIQN